MTNTVQSNENSVIQTLGTVTYDPDDNKLRIYPSCRLDDDEFQHVKELGFRWAPRQECFYASWTPKREDCAMLFLADDEIIEREGSSIESRAIERAERFKQYEENRQKDAGSAFAAADHYSGQFVGGQPILVGHHSERSARVAQKRMHNAMDRATKALDTADYWNYRRSGVLRHARSHHNPRTRANRIRRLMKGLRDWQKARNEAWIDLELLRKVQLSGSMDQLKTLAGMSHWRIFEEGEWMSLWSLLEDKPDKYNFDALCFDLRTQKERRADSEYIQRWISHYAQRIAYERGELGDTPRFDGDLTETILKRFLREFAVHKPTVTRIDDGFTATSHVPIIELIAEGQVKEMACSDDEWRDLMQSLGHCPEQSAPKRSTRAQLPLLNIDVDELVCERYDRNDRTWALPVKRMTKAEYAKIYKDWRGTRTDINKRFRFRSATLFENSRATYVAVFLTDSKAHDMPS